MFLNTLSGRFLLLTVCFVMLAEVLIFVPSVARFREDYLRAHLERAQIASLAVLAASDESVEARLEQELLDNAGVLNVVLRRDAVRELVLSSPMPMPVDKTVDLRNPSALVLIRDAILRIADPNDRIIRVLGEPVKGGGTLIEVTMHTAPLRMAMIDYGLRILILSAVISVITAILLFLAVRRFFVTPIKRVVASMKAYQNAPEDARQIIEPSTRIVELREAEEALRSMQMQLSTSLRQRARLATLGEAVAKISHDLRNMLTTAQLFADRMETSQDPGVRRVAPKLVNSLSRAVNLCETTLAFGKAEEPVPEIRAIDLSRLVADVIENEELVTDAARVSLRAELPETMIVDADPEQMFRVVHNLVRNARQAIESSLDSGEVVLTAQLHEDQWWLEVRDTGPGLPARALENLFAPFKGGVRRGGTGLGLAIAAELVRLHGGRLDLVETGPKGSRFRIAIPRRRTEAAA